MNISRSKFVEMLDNLGTPIHAGRESLYFRTKDVAVWMFVRGWTGGTEVSLVREYLLEHDNEDGQVDWAI